MTASADYQAATLVFNHVLTKQNEKEISHELVNFILLPFKEESRMCALLAAVAFFLSKSDGLAVAVWGYARLVLSLYSPIQL